MDLRPLVRGAVVIAADGIESDLKPAAISDARCGRRAGSFSRQRSIRSSSERGNPGCNVLGGAGVPVAMSCMIDSALGPVNGDCPVIAS